MSARGRPKLAREAAAPQQNVHDNLPVFVCLRNHGSGASTPPSPELLSSPPLADPARELPMDKDDTAAEERMLSRESERLDEFGEPGTSSGEELDMVDPLEAADLERLLAALRRSSRR
ncbi:protein-tyrosine phosphatase [Neofusicoccum parvum]|uniref:Protein-tyrosine phosphatase n=1 Tax=Neofusicoccum parvum TaxID=310453 RepID=A0ACB5RNN6_9PEZI|nr:protein-tyrosine phosphatase [Neofusicoccum parvum]GME34819.1 protein-tyrosine phosphatase [Neofusicoccum parvum]